MKVDCDFPGGNILVDRVENDTLYVRQDLRDTAGQWFYWCFRVREAAGRTVTVQFTDGHVIGVRGPGVSLDEGRTWSWLGAGAVDGAGFRYRVPDDAAEVRFSMGMPYQESHLKAFLDRYRDNPCLETGVLCQTENGRAAERLRIGRLDGAATHRMFLAARHHCCEMMANYVIEGLLASVLSDGETGAWLRERVEFLVVPFVDKDGVEQGDQGKNRIPHDHNRDYAGESRYATVRAIRDMVPGWGGDRLRMVLDVHCPYLRDRGSGFAHNESIFFVGARHPGIWTETARFSKLLADRIRGPIPHNPSDNVPFGEKWNVPATYSKGKSCKEWGAELPGVRIATTLEVAYANARGAEVNAESARAFGADLARAMHAWLREDE